MAFAGILRQSTAVNVIIGPFVSSTDGDTEQTGLTIAQADVRLSKNAGADAQKNDNTTAAHEGDGFYMCELDATDTNTVGQLVLWVHVATALAVRHDFQIIEEAVYDILYASAATGAVPVASIANGAITAAAIATDAIDADALADNAITAATFAANAITSTVVADNTITAAKINADAITAAKIAAGAIDAATFAADVDAEILSYIVNDATQIDASALNTLSSHDPGETIMGATDLGTGAGLTSLATQASVDTIDTNVDAILVDTGTTLDGKLDTIDNFLDTEIAAIVAALIVRSNTAQAGGATTITLDASASATDDIYNNHLVTIISGTGVSQARFITDYNGTTKVATVGSAWQTNPDNTSVFTIQPFGAIPGATAPTAAEVADAVWEEAIADHSGTAGSTAEALEDAAASGASAADIADAVWDEAQAGHVGAGTFGEIATEIAAILVDTGTTLDGKIDIIDTNVDDILVDTSTTLQGELDGIQADTEDIQTRLPAALVSGRIDASVGAMAANVITAAATAADFTTEVTTGLATAAAVAIIDGIVDDILLDTAEIGAAGAGLTNINLPNQTMDIVGNITGNLSGSVGSVTGSVGAIGVGGIVAASFDTAAITAAAIAANAIGASELADDAITAAKIALNAIDADALATDAVTEIVAAIFARAFSAAYGSYTFDELQKMFASVLLGKASGLATTTAVYRNLADSADVITATVDGDGNRTAVTKAP